MTALPCTSTSTALTHRQRAHVRAALAEQAAFRIDQIAALESARSKPKGDLSPAHRMITRTIERGARRALAEVRAAQQRLDDGTYGVCVRCGAALAMEVLEVLPAAADCVACRRLAVG